MYDKRMNDRLIDLNRRYQETVNSAQLIVDSKKRRYIHNLKKLDFAAIYKDLKYRRYAMEHFSTDGNAKETSIQKQKADGFKIAVYTCIVGAYDKVIEPVYAEPGIDYLIFTDQPVSEESVWKKIDITTDGEYGSISPMMMNRKIKILQNDLLMQYDYTIYVDGNIEIVAAVSPWIERMRDKGLGIHFHMTRDCIYDEVMAAKHLKRIKGNQMNNQIADYRQQGFPEHFGLFENSIMVRDNRDNSMACLMKCWWDEMKSYPTRDQVSFPYAVWKNGYPKDKILNLGNNIERNPMINRIGEHR